MKRGEERGTVLPCCFDVEVHSRAGQAARTGEQEAGCERGEQEGCGWMGRGGAEGVWGLGAV